MRSIKQKLFKTARLFLVVLFSFASIIAGVQTAHALDISQESLVVSDQSPTITIHDAGIDDFKITPNLEFNRLNDFITYKLTLKNNDGKKYQIVEITDDNTNSAIELSYIYDSGMHVNNKEIDLTIKYVQISHTPLATITATIKLIDEDDNSQNIPIVVPNTNYTVPNTGANTTTNIKSATTNNIYIIYIILAGLIIATYNTLRRKYQRSNKSPRNIKIATISALILGLIPFIAIATSTKNLQFIIDFNNLQFNGPYTITFNTNGGQPTPSNQTINNGETVTKPTDPQKTGYDFIKWQDENANDYDFTTPVTNDLTLYASYTPKTYNIAYNLNGGTLTTPNPTTYTIETPDITLNNPTKPGHTFTGWTYENITIPEQVVTIPQGSTGDKSYTANFAINSYTVSYNSNGGSGVPSETKNYQETFTEPTAPTKTGYNFTKWLDENGNDYDFTTPATEDLTLYATYTPKTYNITYELNGGTLTTPNPTTYTIETPDFTLNNPTKPNFVFKGWQELGSTTPEKTVTIQQGSTGDKSYEAIFIPTYTVTYDPAGGTVDPATILVGQGEPIGPSPTPEKTGYDFTGWYIGDTKIESDYIVTEDITLTAKYTPTVYTITYDLNGGLWMGTNTNPTTYTVETETFTIEGRVRKFDPNGVVMFLTFLGWTGSNGTTPESTVTVTKGTTGNLTFTAVYLEQVKITFTSDASYGTIDGGRTSGNNSIKEVVYYSGDPISTLPTVTDTRPLKRFSHWEIDNQRIDSNYIVNKTATAIAIFEDWTTVDVVEDLNGKEVHDPELCTKNSYVTGLDNDGNLRHVGQCPKNYVWFNCKTEPTGDNYDYASSCERWRIIGTFNVSNGTKTQKRIKIIRDESIGLMKYTELHYAVQWDKSYPYQLFQNHYVKTPPAGATESEITAFYNQSVTIGDLTYSYSKNLRPAGLELIEQAVFFTGSADLSVTSVKTMFNMYTNERNLDIDYSNTHFNPGRASGNVRWTGLVGLPNLSDWGFSSSGGNGANDRACLDIYNGTSWWNNNCDQNSWIGQSYTMNPHMSGGQTNTISIIKRSSEHNPFSPNGTNRNHDPMAIRPVVFLKAGVTTGKGTGSYSDPYTLGPEN